MKNSKTTVFFKKNKLPLLISTILIILIFFSGPIKALTISLIPSKPSYAFNETVRFTITVNISSGELIPIKHVFLNITGPIKANCDLPFEEAGFENRDVSCDYNYGNMAGKINLSVSLMTFNLSYGYGYGYAEWNGYGYYLGYSYGYGYLNGEGISSFTYIIETKEEQLPVGVYTAIVRIITDGQTFSSSPTNILIASQSSENTYISSLNIPAGQITFINITYPSRKVEIGFMTNSTVSGYFGASYYTDISNITMKIPVGVYGLNSYLEIIIDENIVNSLSWTIIKIYYTDEEVNNTGLEESSLRIQKWDGTNWIKFDGPGIGGVNINENYVWANVTSFSIFGIFGNKKPSVPSGTERPGISFAPTTTLPPPPAPTTTLPPPPAPTTTLPPPPAPTTIPTTETPVWLTPSIGIVLLLIVIIILAVVIVFLKKK